MVELWLKFKNADGTQRRVLVNEQKFVIGRHSASGLSIADGRLSREHLRIERFGDLFMAVDCGSSNGSRLNGNVLDSPAALRDGDVLDLGGVLIRVELAGQVESPKSDAVQPASAVNVPSVETADRSFPLIVFLVAPLLGILVLAVLGGLIYFTTNRKPVDASVGDVQYSGDQPGQPSPEPERNRTAEPPDTIAESNVSSFGQPTDNAANSPQPPSNQNADETANVEQYGTAFLRKAAQNDGKAFLTREQAQQVGGRIKQLSGSPALAANITSAGERSAQIASLAAATNLKPQFIAVAAISRLGAKSGDVGAMAQTMAATLEKLRAQIGSELGDDTLLMLAAYDQVAGGDLFKMRNMLQELANKFPDSSRSIRSVWFLRRNDRITQTEFDAALNFLAVGTITQNPRLFGVKAEALPF